jgi:hypothetical protein
MMEGQMAKISTFASIAALTLSLTVAGGASAATLFKIDPHPSGKIALKLTGAKKTMIDTGSVLSLNDITIHANVLSDFASGHANIKPVGSGLLTDLLFTPANQDVFEDFSFRGQDLAAHQTIDIIVTDQHGASQTLTIGEAKADEDFARVGIIANMPGETIRSVELVDSGGFKEAKLFAFSTVVGAAIPEPATWAMVLLGAGAVGAAMRRRRAVQQLA